MANPTYTLIGTPQVVGSGGASSITFSSIPQTYTDLKVVWSVRTNNASYTDEMNIYFNGVTSGISYRTIFSSGSGTPTSATSIRPILAGASNSANAFGTAEMYIPNYTSSNQKSASIDSCTENNGSNGYDQFTAWLASGTSAISSITMSPAFGTSIAQYSTFYLYGINNS